MISVTILALPCVAMVAAQGLAGMPAVDSDWRSAWEFAVEVKMDDARAIPNQFRITLNNRSERALIGSNLLLQFQDKGGFLGSSRVKGQALREFNIPPHGSCVAIVLFKDLEFLSGQNCVIPSEVFFRNGLRDCQVRIWMGDMFSPKPATESNLYVLSDWYPVPNHE